MPYTGSPSLKYTTMSFYNVKSIDNLLQLWEERQHSAFHQYKLFSHFRPRIDLENFIPLIGSEVNMTGELGNAIKDYSMLRKVMEGSKFEHPTSFLPRVPKNARHLYDTPLAFADSVREAVIHIPHFLNRWNETRRACIVDDSIPIPIIDLRTENWLDRLPYKSFYLKIASPLIFVDQTHSQEAAIQNFLIHEEGDYINIMAWDEDIPKWLKNSEKKKEYEKKINEAISSNNFSKFVKYAEKELLTNASFTLVYYTSIKKNSTYCKATVLDNMKGVLEGKQYAPIDIYNPLDATLGIPVFQRIKMFELINGFCKLMATLPAQHRREAIVIDHIVTDEKPKQTHVWTDLPLQHVDLFVTEKEKETVIIRRGVATEKGYHRRRGHHRRYINPDGTLREVWIADMEIRVDKKEEEIQGGATQVHTGKVTTPRGP